MPEYVRVKQSETGHEFSIVASALAAFPELVVLDKPATRADGRPLPVKPHIKIPASQRSTAEPEAAKATTGREAKQKKESSQ